MKWEYVYVQELLRSRFFEIIIVKRLKETFFCKLYKKFSSLFFYNSRRSIREIRERGGAIERERDM